MKTRTKKVPHSLYVVEAMGPKCRKVHDPLSNEKDAIKLAKDCVDAGYTEVYVHLFRNDGQLIWAKYPEDKRGTRSSRWR